MKRAIITLMVGLMTMTLFADIDESPNGYEYVETFCTPIQPMALYVTTPGSIITRSTTTITM